MGALVAELDAPSALLPVVLVVAYLFQALRDFGIGVRLSLADGLGCACRDHGLGLGRGLGSLLGAVFCLGMDQTLGGCEAATSFGSKAEAVFLTCFTCTTENAGDDLDAAQTGSC